MVSCTKCKNMESVVIGKGELKNIKFNCTKHKTELKITSKIFKDSVRPCWACNGKDFDLIGDVNLGKL